jgi:hypothetical protein
MNVEVDVFPAVVGWKHIYLGCDCSLKELLMMGITMPETC